MERILGFDFNQTGKNRANEWEIFSLDRDDGICLLKVANRGAETVTLL